MPVEISPQFLKLLKQLAQLHVNELAKMRGSGPSDGSHGSPALAGKPVRQGQGLDPGRRQESVQNWKANPAVDVWLQTKGAIQRQRTPFTGNENSGGSTFTPVEEDVTNSMGLQNSPGFQRDITQMTQDSRLSPGFVRLSDAAMAERSANLCDMDADNVLSVWDDFNESNSLRSGVRTNCGRLGDWLTSRGFEGIMVCIIVANVLWMAVYLQVHGVANHDYQVPSESWVSTLVIGDVIFATIFALEVCVRGCASGWQFWNSWISYVDLIVGISCLLEIYFLVISSTEFFDLSVLRLLRMIKIVKSVRMFNVSSILAPLHLLIKCLEACVGMLFWSFLLMSFVQCVAGIIVSELCYGFLEDPSTDPTARELVYDYYGTFTKTMLSMFEILGFAERVFLWIMFANWAPACRVLVENVSEWFSVFFLVYRCVMGFAVLNVVSAVFVQQALKTASSDEDLAFRQKQRDIQAYNRKVKKLFMSIDGSGDGNLTLDEFTKLVQSPKLKFWMSQLELEYHDLLSLFEFLDNGDGQITLLEFIEGAQRLRGSAKALDIWRMETKIEVLFEEVLQRIAPCQTPEGVMTRNSSIEMSGVASVFERSSFQHIRATTQRELSQVEEAGETAQCGSQGSSLHNAAT
eukprot:Skav203812  [mRNA]  locus=scaffold1236:386201:391389:+ [translate_table: standard]